MHILRRLGLVLITPLFVLLLFVTALDFGIIHIAGQPTGIKKILKDSNVYPSLIQDALGQAKQISGDKTEIPLNQKVIQDAAAAAFTPQVLQQSAEQAIDGTYHWLNGKATQPDFHIDLTQVKASFASSVAEAARQRAASLPVCRTAGLPPDFDPFNAACLPRGTTSAQVADQVRNDVINGKGFLEHPVITADTVKNNEGSSPFSTNLKDLPKQFQKAKKTPLILSLLTLLLAVAIIFLSATRRKGVKHIGFILVAVGIFMLIFAYTLNWAVSDKLPTANLKLDNAVLEKDLKRVATNLVQSVDKNYWLFGGVYMVLGAAAVAGASFIGRGQKLVPEATAQSAPVAAPAKTPPSKSKGKSKTIKVL
jgi:hypothetical protein